jgi:hypothetical protein
VGGGRAQHGLVEEFFEIRKDELKQWRDLSVPSCRSKDQLLPNDDTRQTRTLESEVGRRLDEERNSTGNHRRRTGSRQSTSDVLEQERAEYDLSSSTQSQNHHSRTSRHGTRKKRIHLTVQIRRSSSVQHVAQDLKRRIGRR